MNDKELIVKTIKWIIKQYKYAAKHVGRCKNEEDAIIYLRNRFMEYGVCNFIETNEQVSVYERCVVVEAFDRYKATQFYWCPVPANYKDDIKMMQSALYNRIQIMEGILKENQ